MVGEMTWSEGKREGAAVVARGRDDHGEMSGKEGARGGGDNDNGKEDQIKRGRGGSAWCGVVWCGVVWKE
jgi:hypothetical protein